MSDAPVDHEESTIAEVLVARPASCGYMADQTESRYSSGDDARRAVKEMLDELARLTTLEEESSQSFKVRAYEKAGLAVESSSMDLRELSATKLAGLAGVGKSTAAKIRQFLDTGSVDKLEELRAAYPREFAELAKIPGVGPKTLKAMRDKLGVQNLDDLKRAIDEEQIRTLPRMGEASEAKIGHAIERLGLGGKDARTPVAEAMGIAERLVERIQAHQAVVDAQYCGSLRRMAETIGDIDITVASKSPEDVMAAVVELPDVHEVLLSGSTKTSFLTEAGLQVDVRVVEPSQFGAATLYFTGSKAHNIKLRQRAIDQECLLNEYGLFAVTDEGDEELIAAITEQDIYRALDLAFVPPPMREGTGEVDAAASDDLPAVIERKHIRGDLHYHTDQSGDGRSSLEDMVESAAALGYRYLAITDHGEDLAINGSSQAEMEAHRDRIKLLQPDYPKMKILFGCELNIGPTGGLDYSDEFRAEFEYTVASVHSHFDLPKEEQTSRIIAAIEDPTVNSIGHLTGRYIGRRPGIELDYDEVISALVANDVALEINGALQRLDAASNVVRRAVEQGVKLVINTDSHHTSELGRMEYGVQTAQRGWAPKELVVNSWTEKRFLKWVGSRR